MDSWMHMQAQHSRRNTHVHACHDTVKIRCAALRCLALNLEALDYMDLYCMY